MFKRTAVLLVVFLLSIFIISPASAAVLTWEPMVNDTFTGTRAAGFGNTNNALTVSMATLGDYVYVSNYNTDAGTEIWRSSNGTDWEQVNVDGFGDPGEPAAVASFAILAVSNDHLYAFNYLAGIIVGEDHVDVYRYDSGTTWEHTEDMIIGNAGTPMINPYAAVTYNDTLYVSLVDDNVKLAIYGSTDGTTWTKVDTTSLGDNNVAAYAMAVYNNYLYVGTYNQGGTEVWRYDGSTWVIDNISGFNNDDNDNSSIGALTSFGGALYASTDNSSTGTEVWKTNGGGTTDWTKVSDTGFSQGTAVTTTTGSTVFKGKLYIGTAGLAKVFRSADGTSWEQVNADRFGTDDNIVAIFAVLGDYLYAGTGSIPDIGGFVLTTEIYRYYEPTAVTAVTLPETGTASLLNTYILNALLQNLKELLYKKVS